MLCLWIFQRHSTLWTFIIKAASTWHQRPTIIMGKEFLDKPPPACCTWGTLSILDKFTLWSTCTTANSIKTNTIPYLYKWHNLENRISCKLFADEMKVYEVLRNVHKDTQILQNDLNTLEQWSSEWQLSFNTTKCEVLTKNIRNKRPWCLCILVIKCANKANSVFGFVTCTVGPKNPD